MDGGREGGMQGERERAREREIKLESEQEICSMKACMSDVCMRYVLVKERGWYDETCKWQLLAHEALSY